MKSEQCQGKDDLKCTYCSKQFKYDSERRRHEQSHTPQFECKVCMKKFSFISALRRHEKQHERKGSVICCECNRKFRDEILLQRHIKYAHKGTFTCTKCNGTFNSDVALRTHMKTHKPESERRFRCSVEGCTKSFNFSHHLKHHEMTHTDTKQHFCKICGKGFIQSHHLKNHLKSHEPEDWLQCTVKTCSKRFTTEYARNRHLVTHKPKTDSGISSDSSSTCDAPDLEIKESNVSTSDRQAICEDDTAQYTDIQDLSTTVDTLSYQTKSEIGDKAVGDHLPGKPNSDEFACEKDKIEDSFRSCKTVLGGCIMSNNGEVNENCLCAQISCGAVEDEFTPNKDRNSSENNNTIKTAEAKVNKTKSNNEYNIICGGCECRSNENYTDPVLQLTKTKCQNATYIANDSTKMPELEYRTNGTIKIKESIDFDIDMESDVKVEDDFEKVLFPFNSCKSVLGKCIVSGNGTIGEGCLCAKMALQDNSVNSEEIEEITPRPLVTRII